MHPPTQSTKTRRRRFKENELIKAYKKLKISYFNFYFWFRSTVVNFTINDFESKRDARKKPQERLALKGERRKTYCEKLLFLLCRFYAAKILSSCNFGLDFLNETNPFRGCEYTIYIVLYKIMVSCNNPVQIRNPI